MNEWPQYYILKGRTPFAVDMWTWARFFEDFNNRHVAETIIDATLTEHTVGFTEKRTYMRPKCRVSTVFLGLDHNFRSLSGDKDAEPHIFETMIFGGPLDGEMWRCGTYDEAERLHDAAVTQARIADAKLKSIKSKSGAT